jgi:hypothetical protein
VTVRAIRSQAAEHVETGAVVRSAGREAMKLERDGKVLTLSVQVGASGDLYYLPAAPRWDDGSVMPTEISENLQAILTEIETFWGLQPEFRRVD